jgi:hypothetical protein
MVAPAIPENATPANSAAVSLTGGRATAPATVRINDMLVGVASLFVGPIDDKKEDDYLQLSLRITNLSDNPIIYETWSQVQFGVTLKDQNGNYYNCVRLRAQQSERVIPPGEMATDELVFEATPRNVALDLDLPAPSGTKPFQFRIAAQSVARAKAVQRPTTRVASQSQEATPVTPAKYDPEHDPKMISELMAEYRERTRRIENRLRGMTSDEELSLVLP